ncbi:bifunctional lysylphosphatidylglycerol flippase/synthetase MprF [Desulforhabdus amnigena]|jgi:phosphatidylglycerol lysyltransferase|uniref:Phosphatidylglycerol lysyltransferase C-terminal domain-containing protein n=1 Tax=Desulforhabdus amnigena TaxID=40218 RepID=A0A9W6D2J3_9BACT|nr:bifunctional lysylphosphatidylglycerol flippase/synthetase MprF [Desulforhabdus amnigena]NLJ27325.1 bifunctional lysylphosphatidylglycerol flippase/synthetase MprF [Deltaproteobacteria bacterium]GLI34680.1 hypothetical protein DAMNIGENAA_21130 [Desulforhabdus amnigena]
MRKKPLSYLGPLIGVVLFGTALWVLHRELYQYHYHEIIASLSRIPGIRLFAAIAVTFLNYLVLTGYDLLSFRYIGRTLAYPKIALASFIGYAFSNNAGLAMLTGSSVRYRLYSAWGITAFEITKVVAFYTITLWLGLFAVAGGAFLINPIDLPRWLHLPFSSVRPIGFLLLLLLCAYLTAAFLKKEPVSIRGWEVPMPPPGLSILQIAVSGLDWTLAASVLYILLEPTPSLSFPAFLTVFLLGQLSGLVSQVPGGLGVFESVMVIGLAPALPAYSVLASLLAYRMIYYLIPLAVAVVLLGLHELFALRTGFAKAARIFGEWIPGLAPPVFAFLAFISGAVLLVSGATPGAGWRMELLRHSVPLAVVEFSHFLGSIIGVVLLLLARGLQLKLDAAYFLTLLLLGAGMVTSLLKGLDFEEAGVLGMVLFMLLPARRYFYRKASLFAEPFSSGWIASVGIVLLASLWLCFFSFKHVEYRGDLWWTFTFSGNAPRSLRAMVGAVMTCFFIAAVRLLRPAPPRSRPVFNAAEEEKVQSIVRLSQSTSANLALLGDKLFLFSGSGRSFIMYGIEGRSWVAMGDPVGEQDEWRELVWQFHEMCDRYGGWTVFYEVGKENLPLYLDLGLVPFKIGEEARVPLGNFSLEGKSRKGFRRVCNGFEKEGFCFEIVAVEQVPSMIPMLKTISDAWLTEKNTREKRFSLGYFNPAYIRHFPLGIVRKEATVFAFCNILEGAEKEELSVDLMRYLPSAPRDTMEYLFLQLMLWGKAQGYQWFNLGMAPLSGLDGRTLAPAWNRLGSLIYQHGEQFYNFQGLRQYKEKFDPQWEPRYLTCPPGFVLPRILANIASLVSGGMKGVISK